MSIRYIQLLEDDFDKKPLSPKSSYPFLSINKQTEVYKTVNENNTKKASSLILLKPERDLLESEFQVITRFLSRGGSILIAFGEKNSIDIDECRFLISLANRIGTDIRENFNEHSPYLINIEVHSITANIHSLGYENPEFKLKVIDQELCYPLAWSHEPSALMVACNKLSFEKICLITNIEAFEDIYSDDEDNELFGDNLLNWLTNKNRFEIGDFNFENHVLWGNSPRISLSIQATKGFDKHSCTCHLESLNAGLVDNSSQCIKSLPKEPLTKKIWHLHPQEIGNQELQLTIEYPDTEKYVYRSFTPLRCQIDGYLQLEIRDAHNKPCNHITLGEVFTLEAKWVSHSSTPPTELQYELIFDSGFTLDASLSQNLKQNHPVRTPKKWHLVATKVGCYPLVVAIKSCDQKFGTNLLVKKSFLANLDQINRSLVVSLESQISTLLAEHDKRLLTSEVTNIPFKVLGTQQYVEEVYREETTQKWLTDLLDSAMEENYHNEELTNWLFEYIVPTYLTNSGAFVACNPDLADQLIKAHPELKQEIEHCLLYSNNSSELEIKQRLISFIAHEKIGHGSYIQLSILGQQCALLEEYKNTYDEIDETELEIIEYINDSSTLIEEGFSAWCEVFILSLFPTKVAQYKYQRENSLLGEDNSFMNECNASSFFQTHESKYKSRYFECYEYLSYIGREFSPSIAIDAMLTASDINYGINRQNTHDFLKNNTVETLKPVNCDQYYPAHIRLQIITDHLYENRIKNKQLVKHHNRNYNVSPNYFISLFKDILGH